jgi:Fic family protein
VIFQSPSLSLLDLRVIDRIDELRRRLEFHTREPRRWSGLLRRVALARAIRGSNSIEGYHVTEDQAFAALDGERSGDVSDEAWSAVSGYQHAMTYVLELAGDEDFEWSPDLIRSLHYMMLSYDLRKSPGRWRKGPIGVHDSDRGLDVYEGPDFELVPGLVAELVDWLRAPSDESLLVRGAMAHLNLVMIHPFRDGNGRMSRCLQTLLLARGGLLASEFCSIEEYLGRFERDYYAVLAQVGKGRWTPTSDASAWVRFCLVAHYRQATMVLRSSKATERFWDVAEREVAAAGLNERTVAPLAHALSGFILRNSTFRQIEPEASFNVATRSLAEMVKTGLLTPQGEKRGRFYIPSRRLQGVGLDIRMRTHAEFPIDLDPYAHDA